MIVLSSGRATALGALAILLWSTLALLTTMAGPVPPFLMVALTFAIAFVAALCLWVARGGGIRRRLTWPLPVWGLGVGGLFGFHLLYFVALGNAPRWKPTSSTIYGRC